ncbi:MAG TPA: hypothetical protein VMT03_15810 [Polyangia bacterium]|nr:hypothetical protein [Polyangia bacterium]
MSLRHGTLALVALLTGGVVAGGTAWAQVESPLVPAAPGALPPPPPPTPPPTGMQGAPPAAPEALPAPAPMPQDVQAAPPAGPDQGAPPAQDYPIPPNVQGAAVPVQGGGYCFGGPHPAPGGGWEATATPHVHDYAPFDLRLFSYRDGCYYFVGDPRDFGYTGQLYSYYGAHPIADAYGGGWCFMVGPHTHWWRPWSSYFTVVGPWYYWNGPYDPIFWAYWPFYSFYYRSYYPHYYAGGRYFHGGFRVAPPIMRVPASVGAGWRASPGAGVAGGGWRAPAATPYRGAPGYHTGPINRGGAGYGGGWHGGAVPYAAPRVGGGWHGGGSFHGGGGGFHHR